MSDISDMVYIGPSVNAQFELEIISFGLTRRNGIVIGGQAERNSKINFQSDFWL